MRQPSATSATLIERIRNPGDDAAWERFTRFYQPLILRFARGYGCDAHMCRDVAQETLVDLLTIMPHFAYDPSRGRFRTFLYEIVRRRVQSAFHKRRRYALLDVGESTAPWLAAGGPPAEVTEEAWEREWQRQLFFEALARLRERVHPTSYAAFHAYVVEGEDPNDVCRRYDLTVNALYQIRHRLLASLRQIADETETELDDTHG